jgi:hypothetical protein
VNPRDSRRMWRHVAALIIGGTVAMTCIVTVGCVYVQAASIG